MIKLNIFDISAFVLVGIVVISMLYFLLVMAITMPAEFIVAIIICSSGFIFMYCAFKAGLKIAEIIDNIGESK